MAKIMSTESAADIRRRQLRQWIAMHFDGVQSEFIKSTNDGATQINQGELSGLLSSKSFGEKRARRLEEQAKMPRGYLDGVQEPASSAILASEEVATGYTNASTPSRWPFARVTQYRLESLRKLLGPQRGHQAMRDIDEMLETVVLKWERRAEEEKSAAA